QTALCFQRAAELETEQAQQMADESLALGMYQEVNTLILRSAAPTLKLNFLIKILKYTSHMHYEVPSLQHTIQGYQQRCLSIANLFPCYENVVPNGQLFAERLQRGDLGLHMVRQLLHNLVDRLTESRIANRAYTEHNPVDVLYQAYEACVRGWYFNPGDILAESAALIQEQFRCELIQALLDEKLWSVIDVHKNTDAFGIMIGRDDKGWLDIGPNVAIGATPNRNFYSSVNGVELNMDTGELRFFALPSKDMPDAIYFRRKMITVFDLLEMMQNNVASALFSLDEAHPDRPLDPFNRMRIAPANIFKSQLQKTMLATDLLLKYFTTGREINGFYPYEGRPLKALIEHLPYTLKKTIQDFHESQTNSYEEHASRFWIETGEIQSAELADAGNNRIAIGYLPMLIKNHRMMRDARGNLVDAPEEEEGWDLYVLNPSQFAAWQLDKNSIKDRALVFEEPHDKIRLAEVKPSGNEFFLDTVYVIKNSQFIKAAELKDCRYILLNLYNRDRSARGQVLRNNKNAWLSYNVVRQVTEQLDMPHHFTPEYCFAVELTAKYDLLAGYFPEFERLRQLSRISILVGYMKGFHVSLKQSLKNHPFLLEKAGDWNWEAAVQDDLEGRIKFVMKKIQDEYDSRFQALKDQCREVFKNAFKQFNELRRKRMDDLTRDNKKMMATFLTASSQEVTDWYHECMREQEEFYTYKSEHGANYWNLHKHRFSEEIWDQCVKKAKEIRDQRYRDYYEQLTTSFTEKKGPLDAVFKSAIDSFMRGDVEPLEQALADEDWNDLVGQYHKQLVNSKYLDAAQAIEGNEEALARAVKITIRTYMFPKFHERDQVVAKLKMIRQLEEMGLRDEKPQAVLEGPCLWVPSSINTERGGRIVCGGVSIHPQIVEVKSTDPYYQNLVNFSGELHAAIGTDNLRSSRELSATYGSDQRGAANHQLYHQMVQVNHRAEAYQAAHPEVIAKAKAQEAARARAAEKAAAKAQPRSSSPTAGTGSDGEGGSGGRAFRYPPSGAGASAPTSTQAAPSAARKEEARSSSSTAQAQTQAASAFAPAPVKQMPVQPQAMPRANASASSPVTAYAPAPASVKQMPTQTQTMPKANPVTASPPFAVPTPASKVPQSDLTTVSSYASPLKQGETQKPSANELRAERA
ncbi:MAG TPA: hypothetical protein VD770_02655, partial [Coxiellaceae bacterium]|nr:hypothetical protein [Coxiellaceae bacterium]